ncbi:MAG: hypothetical protein U1D55_07410 [Phycisphaerae bacterium]
MGRTVHLTARDRELVAALARNIRVASVAQIARTWFAESAAPTRSAEHRLSDLVSAGMIERFVMLARPELDLESPLVCWRAGDPVPDFPRLASRLAARWKAPLVRTPLVIASRAGGVTFGGTGGRRPRLSEVSHDVSLTAVYLKRFVRSHGPLALWYSEARLAGLGFGDRTRLPDAMIQEGANRTVIELGGAYSAAKLAAFHDFCRRENMGYELW